jgi:multicomponent Na+:H+ antiporter subunit G
MIDVLVSILLIIGSAFFLVASIGLLRLPDVYMRTSANAKAMALGMGCLLLALVLHFLDIESVAVAFLLMLFFSITTSVGAHMVSRAAYLAGSPLWKGTIQDDLAGYYDARIYRLGAKIGKSPEAVDENDIPAKPPDPPALTS